MTHDVGTNHQPPTTDHRPPTTDQPPATVLWRRLDRPGHECARLISRSDRWHLSGTAVFEHESQPCRLDYEVLCDARWRTTSASVQGWLGHHAIEIEILADEAGRWSLNGTPVPETTGCIDVDLNFSPSTNLLPIRRLDLDVGREAEVAAAWLRFPSFRLERLDQRYRRLAQRSYRYESAGGSFTADIEVDDAGFVTRYGFWQAEAAL